MGDVNDPFYLVKDEIQATVDKVRGVLERMERLPEGNGERPRYASQITSECESVQWQLEELDRATAMAEQDFMRFKVDANELASRKRWTAATKTAVSNAERKARSVLDAAKRRGPSGFDPSNASGYDQGIYAANDDYLNREHDNQQLLMRKQDADLDDISVSIQRLGQVGLTIGEELETQGKMIDELEQDVDGTNSRLAAAQRKMNQVLKKAGMKGQMCIIVILTAILIILFLIALM